MVFVAQTDGLGRHAAMTGGGRFLKRLCRFLRNWFWWGRSAITRQRRGFR
jgi:hypothetical protein